MTSYREKQLLAVMKYMRDQSDDLRNSFSDTLKAISAGENISFDRPPYAPAESFEELCERAAEAGYDTFIRAEDILSAEELADIERRKDDIESQFKQLTKLHPADYGFLAAAIALQIIRQVIQPSLDFESLEPNNREGHDAAAKSTSKDKAIKKEQRAENYAKKQGIDFTFSGEYYAPLADIINIEKGVPYDETAIKGLGGGKLHRFRTLGHDPALGYLFGTCNILTNTLTKSNLSTIHVMRTGRTVITAEANTREMFRHSKERYHEKGGKLVVAAAVAKQTYHIHSDQKSKEGIGLPFLQALCDDKTIRALCQEGIDYNALEFLGTVAKQSVYSELINFIIAIAHRIFVAKEEYENFCKKNGVVDETNLKNILTQKNIHDLLLGNKELTELRTRKILLTSNAVASCANIVYVGVVGSVSAYSGNTAELYKALSKLDVGGILTTVIHLLADTRIIAKIKDDFIKSAINNSFKNQCKEFNCT